MVCDIRIIKKTKKTIIGRLLQVHDMGPHGDVSRIRCAHHIGQPGELHEVGCGGCKRQSVTYADQLSLKQSIVQRSMYAHGVAIEVLPTVPSPDPRGYRNKIEYTRGNYITGRGEEKRTLSERSLGFHKQ
jgi:tRNA/tmRNA/rRNA uracil-C5-methylase (TrmA/RlmC/RlmD family)